MLDSLVLITIMLIIVINIELLNKSHNDNDSRGNSRTILLFLSLCVLFGILNLSTMYLGISDFIVLYNFILVYYGYHLLKSMVF